jgi:hypothetical protein
MTDAGQLRHLGRLTLAALLVGAAPSALSCDGGRLKQLEGRWVGTVESDDDLFFIQAEFTNGWTGLSGTAKLKGTGKLALGRTIQYGKDVFFQMQQGNETFDFNGRFNGNGLSGTLRDSGPLKGFHLQKVVQVDHRLLESYAGVYRLGSDRFLLLENCASGLGWDQLIYVNHETGARKALFPISESSFFFGPGFLLPTPPDGMLTFVQGADGRSSHLIWDEFGESPRIAERIGLHWRDWKHLTARQTEQHCRRVSG